MFPFSLHETTYLFSVINFDAATVKRQRPLKKSRLYAQVEKELWGLAVFEQDVNVNLGES